MKILCASAKATNMPTPDNKISDNNTIKLTRHIILSYDRVVWEANNDNLDIFFEHGTIDGYYNNNNNNNGSGKSADSVLIAFDKIEEEISYGKFPHNTIKHNSPNGARFLRHNKLLKIRDKCAKETVLIDALLIEKILHYAVLQLQ